MARESHEPGHMDAAARAIGRLAARPRLVVALVLSASVALSWLVLAAMAQRAAEVSPRGAGPGSALMAQLPDLPLPPLLERFFALCLTPAPAGSGLGVFTVLFAMWMLMALAMMLPTALPMIRTYCEIAETAAAKGQRVVHPLVLVAGYVSVWGLAAVAFAALGVLVQAVWGGGAAVLPLAGPAGAGALAVAGLYQFTGLKKACLHKCRNPFAVLFARFTPRPAGIFRLGAEQGLWCLGCCWALMLVMLAVGLMNVFWMALIAAFTAVEKQGGTAAMSRGAGAILLVWAAALLLVFP